MIYLDHNATTPLEPRVLEAMVPYLTDRFGNASSYYQLGRDAREAVEEARERVAACIGGRAEEIIFTAGGTEADNLALRGVARSLPEKGKHLVTSCIEHHAVLETCKALAQEGFEVTFVPVDGEGRVDPDEVRRNLRPDTILLSVMAANNETGVIQPLAEIGGIARERGVLLHTDAVQALGKMRGGREGDARRSSLRVGTQGLRAQRGGRALRASRHAPDVMHDRGAPRARSAGRDGERGRHRRTGRSHSPRHAKPGTGGRTSGRTPRPPGTRDSGANRRCQSELWRGARVPNTSNLSFPSVDGESILLHLDLRGICASTGSACTTDSPEPSHVLQAMGLEPRTAQGSIRFSLGHHNTAEEIDQTVEAMAEIVPRLATISSVS